MLLKGPPGPFSINIGKEDTIMYLTQEECPICGGKHKK